MGIHRKEQSFRLQPVVFAVHLALAGAAIAAPAPNELPGGGQVVSGQATIQQTGAAQLQIHQTTARAALDWQTFNIGAQAQVNFQQPDANAVALNRVVQGDASVIEGKLTANGQVFLVNPGGVLFGRGAQVDVGGLVATTMNISNQDFAAGNDRFTRGGATGEVVNQGHIRAANGGYVALVAATVRNEGTVTANGGGTVALAAGDGVRLEFGDGKLVNVQVDPATVKALVENKQLVQARDGRVLMTAVAASTLQGAVINNSGSVEANSITSEGGVIRLTGADEIDNSGTLDASGATAGGNVTLATAGPDSSIHQAGSVKARAGAGQGGDISLSAGAGIDNTGSLDASGETAGGSVKLIADSSHSAGDAPLVRQAGSLHADATAGRGGKVVLTGEHLQLDNGSLTTAKGATGGGQIYAGGGEHGADASIRNAQSTRVEAGAVLDASATDTGDGGTIIAWGDDAARAYGTLNAKGGPNGGNGGLVETSGHWLDVNGVKVDASAPQGKVGEWLLDPWNVVITGGNANTDVVDSGGTKTWTPNGTPAQILNTAIQDALLTSNVTVKTTATPASGTENGDITVSSPIAWSTDKMLTLQADGNINVNATLNASGDAAGLMLNAASNINITSPVANPGNSPINLTGDHASLTLSYGAVAGNGYFLNNGAKITLSGLAPTLKVGPAGSELSYTVITSLGVAGDTSASTLQGMGSHLGTNYALGTDIDASATIGWNGGAGFNPIGRGLISATAFTGSFDGLGHIIDKLFINLPTTDYVGLFGTLQNATPVSHVGLTHADVTGRSFVGILAGNTLRNFAGVAYSFSTGKVTGVGGGVDPGGSVIGGLIGQLERTANQIIRPSLSYSFSTAAVAGVDEVGGLVGRNGGNIIYSYSHGAVQGRKYVGGLIGKSQGFAIYNLYSTGSVSGEDGVGGLIGILGNASNLYSSYSMGAVHGTTGAVGGLVGTLDGAYIHDSYSTGAVSANVGNAKVGGLVGYVQGAGSNIYFSYWDTDTSGRKSMVPGEEWKAGIGYYDPAWAQLTTTGFTPDLMIKGLTTAQMMDGSNFPVADDPSPYTNWDRSTWSFSPSDNLNYYPYLSWRFPTTPQVVSGRLLLSDGSVSTGGTVSGQTIKAARLGQYLDNFPATYRDQPQASTGNNGFYYMTLNTNAVPTGNTLLVYQSAAPVPPAVAPPLAGTVRLFSANTATNQGNLLNLNLNPQQLAVKSDTSVIGSADLATAARGIAQADPAYAPYSVSATGDGITVNGKADFKTVGLTHFNLGGDITTDADLTINSAVTLTGDATLNSGSGKISLGVAPISGIQVSVKGDYFLGLNTKSNFTQTGLSPNAAGALQVSGLELLGAGTTYTLTNADNRIGTLAGNTGSVNLVNNAALTVGSVDASSDTSHIATDGLTASGKVTLQTTGDGNDITLATTGRISSNAAGDAVALISGRNFINNVPDNPGQPAIDTPAGRWIVYSNNPMADVFGGLVSGNNALWNSIAPNIPPDSGHTQGNRFMFLMQPTVTLTPAKFAKSYGADSTDDLAIWPIIYDGFYNKNGAGTAFVQDDASNAFSGRLGATVSAGTAPTAPVAGSPYATTPDIGSLLSTNGNAVVLADGQLTVNPATLTYTADPAQRLYGVANPAFTGTVTGFVLNDTESNATTGTKTFTSPATQASNVGQYAINGSGLSATTGNYIFGQAASNATALTVNPATLTYTADPAQRLYGVANPAFTGSVTGFVLTDTESNATTGTKAFTSPATQASNVGQYAIDGSGLSANNGNYVFVQAASNHTALTVNPATLTYVADPVQRPYGVANPAFTGSITGFVLTDTESNATTGTKTFTSAATQASNVGQYAIDGSGLSANNGNYVFVQALPNATALTVNPAALTLTAKSQFKLYGNFFNFTGLEFSQTGLQNNETIGSVNLTSAGAPTTANVGNYPINITPGSASGGTFTPSNYTIAYVPGNMTVSQTRLILDLTANNQIKTYGTAFIFTGNEFTAAGLENGDSVNSVQLSSAGAPASANVGSYSINIAPGSAVGNFNPDNYTITYVNGNMIVNPRAISLTAGSNPVGSRYFGDPTNPLVGYSVGGAGMANGENAKAVFGFTVGSAANRTTAAGVYLPGTAEAYKIGNVGVGSNGNYNITAIDDGTMTILPIPQPAVVGPLAGEIEPKYGPRYNVNTSGTTLITGDYGEYRVNNGSGRALLRFLRRLLLNRDELPPTFTFTDVSPMDRRSQSYRLKFSHHIVSRSSTPVRATKYPLEYGLHPFDRLNNTPVIPNSESAAEVVGADESEFADPVLLVYRSDKKNRNP
jgi:filamentous hemagglutinin family protein